MVVPSSLMAFDDWFLESPDTDLDPILQLSRRMWSTCARFPGTSWSCWWRASSWTSNRGPSNSNSTKKLSTRPSKNATLEIWRKLAASSRIVSKKKVIPSSWPFLKLIFMSALTTALSAHQTKGRSFSLPWVTIKNSCPDLAKCPCYLGPCGRAASHLYLYGLSM